MNMRWKSVVSSAAILVVLQCAPYAHGDAPSANVYVRGGLANARGQLASKKPGHVAFLGGSITEMAGYRPLVCDLLQRRFPQTKFTFTNAGVASTCSTTGAFRLATDVLAAGPVDLLFVEFAVNDDQDAHHTGPECIRGMEGIVRQLRRHNPRADIVMIHFPNEGMLKSIEAGKSPLSIASHEAVARHYAIPTIDVAAEVAERIRAGTMTWEKYGGVHPARPGNELCAALVGDMLDRAEKGPLAAAAPYPMPDPLDPENYGSGRFVALKTASLGSGWSDAAPDWQRIPGDWRTRFRAIPMLTATRPDAELTLAFEGRAVGAYVLAGPDAGIVETSIDGGPYTRTQLYHPFSRGLHYPRTVLFATELHPGPHRLKLRVSVDKQKESTGHAVRIIHFVAN